MTPEKIYALMYFEINLVSVLLIWIIKLKTKGITEMFSQRNFTYAINAQMAFYISDTVHILIATGFMPYSKSIVLISKSVYFISCTLMCYFWFVYFEMLQGSKYIQNPKILWGSSVFVWVMLILSVINLFTGILFYVDDQNIYRRGKLFIVQYLLAYIYVFFTCFKAAFAMPKAKGLMRRKLRALALFPIAPAGAGIVQFVYPQLPLACAALAIATLIMYLGWTDEIISMDPLTKLNNRKMLQYFYDQWLENESDDSLYLIILDANKFKSINDTYGHIEGDAALIRIAEAMRLGCNLNRMKSSLIRYGGDEFVILINCTHEEPVTELTTEISSQLTKLNEEAKAPYPLTVSFGIAKAEKDMKLQDLIDEADSRLYEAKRKL